MKSALRRGMILLGALLAAGWLGAADAQHVFDGNILFQNLVGDCNNNSLAWDACDLVAHFAYNDPATDPQLAAPYDTLHPSWVPAWGSPAIGGFDHVVTVPFPPADACFSGGCDFGLESVCWRGALPPAAWGADWTEGWTYYLSDGYDYENDEPRQDIDYGKPLVTLSGPQAASYHMVAANNYLVVGKVNFLAGTTLTIDPGVTVFGDGATNAYIVIERDADIQAVGTAAQPVIMTSNQFPGEQTRGGWGGLVIHGKAVANCAGCQNGEDCESEGGAGFHCGNDDCDDSGTMRYVRVEYAGHEIAPNNELNAFTFNSVGAQSDFAYLQAHMGSDDNFEWFGGKGTFHHLVATGGADDNFDWQMGFRGAIQFAVSQTWPGAGDRAIEGDNNEFNHDAACRSNPLVSNLTLIGPGPGGGTSTDGIHLRRGTDAQIVNSIIMGWTGYGIQVKDAATVARGFGPQPSVYCSPASVEVNDASRIAARVYPRVVARTATFAFSLPTSGQASVSVYDATGRLVDAVLDAELQAGAHTVSWERPAGALNGVYFYRVATPSGAASGRFLAIDR